MTWICLQRRHALEGHQTIKYFTRCIPAIIYLFKVKNGSFRTTYEICSKLTVKTPFSSVSVVDFEQANVSWDNNFIDFLLLIFLAYNIWYYRITKSRSFEKIVWQMFWTKQKWPYDTKYHMKAWLKFQELSQNGACF